MFQRIHKRAPFTQEDHEVVAQLVFYRRGICWLASLLTSSYDADERDSLVMYRRARFIQQGFDAKVSRMPPALYWVFYPWR